MRGTEPSTHYADAWIIVPAFNEGRMITVVVKELRMVFTNVVVVDDGSSDETGPASRAAGAIVLRHPINLGQGAALQTGIDYALNMGALRIVTFDADGQHKVSDARHMLDELERSGADVALGSRFLGHAEGISVSRRLILRLAMALQYATTGVRLTDAHNGLRAFTRGAARSIHIKQNRMAHASEIIAKIAKNKLSIVEVPCTVIYTKYSLAKGQRPSEAVQILLDLLMWRLYK